jgi:uncharacterized protein
MQFDWDDGNRAKCLKHGLDHEAIEFALAHGAKVAADPVHSLVEQRFIAVSRTREGRAVYIVFCLRGEKVRPISARYMHRKEAIRHGFAS